MRIRLYSILIIILLLWVGSCQTVSPQKIPLGVYTTMDNLISKDLSILNDSLGVNFVYGTIDTSLVDRFKSAGLNLIRWGSSPAERLNSTYGPDRLSACSYVLVNANDDSSQIRFEVQNGIRSDSFLVSADSGIMLDNLWFYQYIRTFSWEEPWKLVPKINLRIDPRGARAGTLIGTLFVHRLIGNSWEEVAAINIYPNSRLLRGEMATLPESDISFSLCNNKGCDDSYAVKYSFLNNGKTKLFLNYFKCYDEIGRKLMETDIFDDSIAAAVHGPDNNWRNKIDYWWLRDEPRYDSFRPWGKVRQIVDSATAMPKSIGAIILAIPHGGFDSTSMVLGLKSFLNLTGQKRVVVNDYPYNGGYKCWGSTDYTGYSEFHMDKCAADSRRGLQLNLEKTTELTLGVLADEAKRDKEFEFWYSPQWFYSAGAPTGNELPDSRYIWRPPTRSELRLQIFMGLCYGAKGFNLWRYDYGPSDCGTADYTQDKCAWQGGFYDGLTGESRKDTLFWNTLKRDINPYLKAIENTYMGLTWERAYNTHNQQENEYYLNDVYGWCDSYNPDSGWAQVGEFHNGNDKFIILVNRACSKDEKGSEAPPQHFSLRLNSENLGLGNNVYLIDLAKTIYHTKKNGWVGKPDTTAISQQIDGTFRFETTLKAGEGKLFKIARAATAGKAR
jgi:hypothetical protein